MPKKRKPKRRHTAAILLRLMPEHDRLIREAADYAGISLSDWLRDRLIRLARRELRERDR